jgi:hypothetical protein
VSNPFNKRTGKAYTAAQMASYLYKYVSKNLSGAEFNKKSYWVSQNIAPPVRTVLLFRTYAEAFSAAIEHFQSLGLSFGTEKHRYWRDEAMNVLARCRIAQLVLPSSKLFHGRIINEAR